MYPPSIPLLHLVALVALVVHIASAAVAECFYPDGKSSGSGLIPCDTNATHSHCCRDSDMCLTNGFCFSFGLNALVRRGCTDPTWNSTKCAQECSTDVFRSADVVMTICDQYTMFCCGQNAAARNCCTSGNGTVHIIPGEPMPPYSAVITQSSCPPSTCPSTEAGNGGGKSCSSQKNTTIAVGAALGVATLVAAALGAVFFFLRRAAVGREADANRRNEELLSQQQAAVAREVEATRQNQDLLSQQQAAAAREEEANRRYQELLNQRRVFE